MPPLTPGRVIRLALDLNVLWSDQRARDGNVRGTAASMLVDAVRDGTCAAGPVQLITSVAVIEAWADVLRRHFGYGSDAAREKADLLQEYAAQGPLAAVPNLLVGSGYIPFGTEREVADAIRAHARPGNADKLFDELTDDRHILLAALAGEAAILATSDIDLFRRGSAVALERPDVVLYPSGSRTLAIAKPSFVAYWLRAGIVPDLTPIEAEPDAFRIRGSACPAPR